MVLPFNDRMTQFPWHRVATGEISEPARSQPLPVAAAARGAMKARGGRPRPLRARTLPARSAGTAPTRLPPAYEYVVLTHALHLEANTDT